MLRISKEAFFANRKLENKKYWYLYNEKNYEIPLDYVISKIGSSEEKCLFILNELNATNDFLVEVYLRDLANDCIQNFIKRDLGKEIEKSLLDDAKSYKFSLGTDEYIAYEDDEGRYHVDEINQVGIYAGNARYSKFQDRLYGLLDSHTFGIQKIEDPAVE